MPLLIDSLRKSLTMPVPLPVQVRTEIRREARRISTIMLEAAGHNSTRVTGSQFVACTGWAVDTEDQRHALWIAVEEILHEGLVVLAERSVRDWMGLETRVNLWVFNPAHEQAMARYAIQLRKIMKPGRVRR